MFLYRKRPRVVPKSPNIILHEQQLRGSGSGAKGFPAERHVQQSGEDEYPKSGIDFKTTADEKTLPGNDTILFVLPEQQAGNEEAAQHKEQIHSDPSALVPYGCNLMEKRTQALRTRIDVA